MYAYINFSYFNFESYSLNSLKYNARENIVIYGNHKAVYQYGVEVDNLEEPTTF